MRAFEAGDLDSLLAAHARKLRALGRRRPVPVADALGAARAAALAALDQGFPGRALSALSPRSSLPPAEALDLLSPLHPADTPPPPAPGPKPPAYHLSDDDVAGAVRRLSKLAAPGPSGTSYYLLRLAAFVDPAPLASVVRSVASGSAPAWLADARLFGVPKPGGGARPIAVGESIRRLAAVLLNTCAIRDPSFSMPAQLVN